PVLDELVQAGGPARPGPAVDQEGPDGVRRGGGGCGDVVARHAVIVGTRRPAGRGPTRQDPRRGWRGRPAPALRPAGTRPASPRTAVGTRAPDGSRRRTASVPRARRRWAGNPVGAPRAGLGGRPPASGHARRPRPTGPPARTHAAACDATR